MVGEGTLTIVFYNLFRERFTDEMTIEEKPKGSERVSHLNNLGTEHGRRNMPGVYKMQGGKCS